MVVLRKRKPIFKAGAVQMIESPEGRSEMLTYARDLGFTRSYISMNKLFMLSDENDSEVAINEGDWLVWIPGLFARVVTDEVYRSFGLRPEPAGGDGR